jgi:hypothetical protein
MVNPRLPRAAARLEPMDEFKFIVGLVREGGPIALALAFAWLWWRADNERRDAQKQIYDLAISGTKAMHAVESALAALRTSNESALAALRSAVGRGQRRRAGK